MIALSSVGRRVESSTAIASMKKAEFSDEDDEIDREHLRYVNRTNNDETRFNVFNINLSRRLLSRCKKFEANVSSCRKSLSNFFSSALLDSMADQARRADDLGRKREPHPHDRLWFCSCVFRLPALKIG